MKCSRPDCGRSGEGRWCQECGGKMMEATDTPLTVLCPGKLEDDAPCNAKLTPVSKFCVNCGLQVDPRWFHGPDDVCTQCGEKLVETDKFCSNCGLKKSSRNIDGVKENQTVAVVKENLTADPGASVTACSVSPDTNSSKAPATPTTSTMDPGNDVIPTGQRALAVNDVPNKEHAKSPSVSDTAKVSTEAHVVKIENKPMEQSTGYSHNVDSSKDTGPSEESMETEPSFHRDTATGMGINHSSVDHSTGIAPGTAASVGEAGQHRKDIGADPAICAVGPVAGYGTSGKQGADAPDKQRENNPDKRGDNPDKQAGDMAESRMDVDDDEYGKGSMEDEDLQQHADSQGVRDPSQHGRGLEAEEKLKLESIQKPQRCVSEDSNENTRALRRSLSASGFDEKVDTTDDDDDSTDAEDADKMDQNDERNNNQSPHSASSEPPKKKTKVKGEGSKKKQSKKKREHKSRKQQEKFGISQTVANEKQDKNVAKKNDSLKKSSTTSTYNNNLNTGANIQNTEANAPATVAHETATVFGKGNVGLNTNIDTLVTETVHYPPDAPSFFQTPTSTDSNEMSNRGVQTRSQTAMAEGNDGKTGSSKNKSNSNTATNQQNKPKQEQSSQQKQMSNYQNNKQQTSGNSTGVTVVFHMLVSQDLLENDSDKLLVRFGAEELGGWNFTRHVCSRVRKDKYIECEYKLKVDKYLIQKGIPYKYCKQTKDQALDYEHYNHRLSNDPTSQNRTLRVDQHLISNKVEWHQYDGIVGPKHSTSVWQKLKSLVPGKHEKPCETEALYSAMVFSPRLFQVTCDNPNKEELTITESIEQLESLVYGLRRVYVTDIGCWKSFPDMQEKVGLSLMVPLIERIANTAPTNSDPHCKIVQAMAVVVALKRLQIPIPQETLALLCTCLALTPDPKTRTCKELESLNQHFKEAVMKKSLIGLLEQIGDFKCLKDASWWFCVPLLHILYDVCQPYEPLQKDLTHRNNDPKWWGICYELKPVVDKFLGSSAKWTVSFEKLIEKLQPMFEVDLYLPRTIMASLQAHEVGAFIHMDCMPVEVCCACVIYWMQIAKNAWYSWGDKTGKLVCECIDVLLQRLQQYFCEKQTDSELNIRWWMAYRIAAELVIEALNFNNKHMNVVQCGHIFLHCISVFDKLQGTSEKNVNQAKPDHILVTGQVANKLLEWMWSMTKYWLSQMEDHLKLWNDLFAEQMQSEYILELWNGIVSNNFQTTLHSEFVTFRSSMGKEFIAHYCKHVDQYSKPMQECLSKEAFLVIEYATDWSYLSLKETEKKRFGKLMSNLFEQQWNLIVNRGASALTEDRIFNFMLTWPPIKHFIQNTHDTKNQILSASCTDNLNIGVTLIQSHRHAIIEGAVKISTLKDIFENKTVFSELVQLINPTEKNMKAQTLALINARMKEKDEFLLQVQMMTTFVNHCQPLPALDTTEIDGVLKWAADIDRHSVVDFCKPIKPDPLTNGEFKPEITAFAQYQTLVPILSRILEMHSGFVFYKMWQNQCQVIGYDCTTVDDVVQMVWQPVIESWNTFSEQLNTGQMTFRTIEHMLGNTFKNDMPRIQEEMKALGIKENIIEKRIDQLRQNRQIGACVNGAKVILKFQQQFKLKGDFEAVKKIASHADRDFKMIEFNENLTKTCEFLKEITVEKTRCLYMFVQCTDLITWLKESMKTSGQKELKVFVDLAMMSAGEEPMNIAKVQCLHSAVIGYAPLIFELKEDCGYKKLLEMCKYVWRELEANPNLPKQLEDTNHELKWLQDIKKAHGSVEVTSLMQSEAINDFGIYSVGRNAWHTDTTADPHNKSMSDTVKLTVPGEEGKRQLKHYAYTQLQDLQSRLMLVAGKAESGNKNVERFTMIFDSIVRLSNVYMKLCTSGCVLFDNWTARFFCTPNEDRPVCAMLEFGSGEDLPKLRGRKRGEEQLEVMIPDIARFMETCLEQWLRHIREKRSKYFHLNYFTIDQLVILQRELVKMLAGEMPSDRIYPLLQAVKEECTPNDVMAAMRSAKNEIDSMEADIDLDREEEQTTEVAMEVAMEEHRQAFIAELVESGFDQMLAERACAQAKPEDIANADTSEALIWCMRNGNDSDTEESGMDEETDTRNDTNASPDTPSSSSRNRSAASFDSGLTGWSNSEVSIQSMITDNLKSQNEQSEFGVKPLRARLEQLWHTFLDCVSSKFKDYLSLEHLGLILKHLAIRDMRDLHRRLPVEFKEGEPNLVICPSSDIINMTLSVYMFEREQPLPLADEVLMCTSKTTLDQVDIFWRRAIFGQGEKIHCLVNADLLSFDVSESAGDNLEEYLQEIYHDKEKKFRLLVICGSDNEYRSTMVSCLDKYLRQTSPVNTAHLLNYVTEKLIHRGTMHAAKPAATVDFGHSTARLVKSTRAGVGKTLFVKRRVESLTALCRDRKTTNVDMVSIPLQEKRIDLDKLTQRLLAHTTAPGVIATRIFHIPISHEVQEGIDYLLFNLLILNCLVDKSGYIWRRSTSDLYLIETMPIMIETAKQNSSELQYLHPVFNILPDVMCRSPQESLRILSEPQPGMTQTDQLFDEQEFRSTKFQRPFQYLLRLDQNRNLNDVNPREAEEKPDVCLNVLLRHCGVADPSWSELHHFVWFLNTQLIDFERNQFVSIAASEDLPGFGKFVLKFLMQMSRDFSTRSLIMSEESPTLRPVKATDDDNDDDNDALDQYQMRRTWESSPHPYLFFNSDRMTFTFLGFYIEPPTGNLIDQQTGMVLEKAIMPKNLQDALRRNHVPIQEDFDGLPRAEKITKLCTVMGNDMAHDPDDTYELTTDNVKKIMAIYMRFRCDIPVIIMGETGCGKTRLIKFMCALQTRPGQDVKNMILMKVHGGTTNEDIKRKVQQAEQLAKLNREQHGHDMYTVLFFDEANTTESIGLIKEIMCDKSIEGRKLELCDNLKMVAACNPYRKHSDELIKKLEQAGLGYHVDADDTTDRLGRVPMRRLVYRVQPLPQSLLPLVWDFGQLDTNVEDLYIRQMVRRYIREGKLPDIDGLKEVVSDILTHSQDYMRNQKDECSFVSLRDVDRVLTVMSWFYSDCCENRTLFDKMDERLVNADYESSDADESDEEEDESADERREEDMEREENGQERQFGALDDVTRSLVLSLGVCYHACLKTRDQYRQHVAARFRAPCVLHGGEEQILEEIECCQDVFLDNVSLDKNIARNMALKENVFMMIVCIELRIPLFLVGKPGSSKSLAKTIVSDAMQGNSAKYELFKTLKQAQMVSFQCSPLSTPDGIVGTFRQCAQFQKDKDLDSFVSIVVLDEVGLAEDSPRMPLKTLHPLLEDGCQGDEQIEPHKKVAFIGISNWALDPAKMNRGILVQREVPDLDELINSARGICTTTEELDSYISPLIQPLSIAYLEIFKMASQKMREFFGLRDFYSLMKMVYSFVEASKKMPTWYEMLHAIKRNFGGLDQVDPVNCFKNHLSTVLSSNSQKRLGDPDCTSSGLIQACLFGTKSEAESRYLLLLTENYGALSIIQQQILAKGSHIRPIIIFGSSFRSDQEYTQVCRNINKIKVCMETGNTVVLLNLENLYESLYDALNQYYVYFGGERYVDLGLGTHRVKCPVHKHFRLIVVAEKQTVYKSFPIPLINRLEKHFLNINTMLNEKQQHLVTKLEEWARDFALQQQPQRQGRPTGAIGDVLIGFHEDTCSAVILHVSGTQPKLTDQEILWQSKLVLLWCATPESIVKLSKSALPGNEQRNLKRYYHEHQSHNSFVDYMRSKVGKPGQQQLFAQVTTHSKLLAGIHKAEISEATGISVDRLLLLETLSSFDTEQQFTNRIRQHLHVCRDEASLMVIQCDSGDVNANLIACARYCVNDEYETMRPQLHAPVHVVFIIQLPRKRGGCFTGFQCGVWHSAHIDDLYPEDPTVPSLPDMMDKKVSEIFQQQTPQHRSGPEMMDVGEPQAHRGSMSPDDVNETVIYGRLPNADGDGQPMDVDTENAVVALNDISVEIGQMDLHGQAQHPGSGDRGASGTGAIPKSGAVHAAHPGHNVQSVSVQVEGLLTSCIQSALSMVKDSSETLARETDRVNIVLKCMDKSKSACRTRGQKFVEGLRILIGRLLGEKDAVCGDFRAKYWLENEAAALESINKAGTFRRSCLHTLMAKISPVLAGIIAHLDTNQNLDLLLYQDMVPWKQEFWLQFLHTAGAVQLQYSDLQSPKRHSDLVEVIVMTTGFQGHNFKSRLPFSWVIVQKLTEIMKSSLPENEEDGESESVQTRVDRYSRVVMTTPIGQLLQALLDNGYHSNQAANKDRDDMVVDDDVPELQEKRASFLEEVVSEYIHDFVHTHYKPASQDELQIVCQSVLYKTLETYRDCETRAGGDLVKALLCVHFTYNTLALRLSYFRDMNAVWSNCSAAILEVKAKDPDDQMFTEQEFTFSALCLLIKDLEPCNKDLNERKLRSGWLNKVHCYRPVIEKVISLHREDPALYGRHSDESVRKARVTWSRVMILKLFIEDICTTEGEDIFTNKKCMPLWSMMGKEVNLKEIKSLNDVEEFLKLCNMPAVKLYLGKDVKCSRCETVLEGPPVTLPCDHLLCDKCFHEMRAMDENQCSSCRQLIPPEWIPQRTEKDGQKLSKLSAYQKRCNMFFMDIVSQLCFADQCPPSRAVIEKLLKYITIDSKQASRKFTKQMTIFDTGIDPNPVFRSFLLQLLLRTSEDIVKESLEEYLRQAKVLINRPNASSNDVLELSLLVIQCLEDTLMLKYSTDDVERCRRATDALRFAQDTLDIPQLSIQKLYGIAHARTALSIVAMYLHTLAIQYKKNNKVPTMSQEIRNLVLAARNLCENEDLPGLKIYLVKYLCRVYGLDVYQGLCKCTDRRLNWIALNHLTDDQETMEVSDRYIVVSDQYRKVREAVTKVTLGEDIAHLQELLQELHTAGVKVDVLLQLAIHREITCSYVRQPQHRKHTDETLRNIQTCIEKTGFIKDKQLVGPLLQNSLQPRQLVAVQGSDVHSQGLQCLLVHFIITMSKVKANKTLLHPLHLLMSSPHQARDMFLPSMPQDDLEEIREALLAARRDNPNENAVLYRCPNGHPYVIGNCGRPDSEDTCKGCGEPIGGVGHQLNAGNILDAGADNTQSGHILGRAATRGMVYPERGMTAAITSVVRFILHMAMYTGSAGNPQEILGLIKPDIVLNEVKEYLWRHIQQDMVDLQRVLGRSADDVFLIMHAVVNNLLTGLQAGAGVNEETYMLRSKRGRKDWETHFTQHFIQATFQDIEGLLKTFNQQIAKDDRLGANPLLCVLYETENPVDVEDPQNLENVARVWRYRTPISIEHLRQEFEARYPTGDKLGTLRLFLQQDHILQALHYIPSIMCLQRLLMEKYHRKLDKAEGNSIAIKHIIQEQVAGPDTEKLVNDFRHAWELVREGLTLYMCSTEVGGMTVPKEFCSKPIDENTPLSMLLPASKEAGLCSYAMLDFLFRKQNDFLDKYLKRSHRDVSSVSCTAPSTVTAAHLISYQHQSDILPLILANCQYTFEMGRGTKIEYDFASIERQLMDRFLFSKSRIDVGRVLQIELMVYRTEFTNAVVFNKLADKIPQVQLSAATKSQISEELRSLPEHCRCLDNLDIAISFLKTTGGRPHDRLYDFMAKTLQIEAPITSQKAEQMCQLQHARSLWLLMSLRKSKMLIDARATNTEVFESLLPQFHENMGEDLAGVLENAYLRTLSVDKLSQLIEALHEFMLLQVAVRENTEDEDYMDTTNNELGVYLNEYIALQDEASVDTEILTEFPADIKYKHAVHAWITAYSVLKEKLGGNRRY